MKLALISAAAASVLAIAAIPAAASAQTDNWSGWYGNLGYTGLDVTNGGPNLGGVTGRIGWKSNIFLGVEGEATVGVVNSTVGANKFKENDAFAGYITATAPLAHNFDVFARVGYGTTDIKSTPAGAGGSDQSWNYGGGAQYFFDPKDAIRGDYTREQFQNGGGDANVWSVAWVRRF